MACDLQRAPRQSQPERATEVREAMAALERALLRRQVRPVVGAQGAITFANWSEQDRKGISDACAYRLLMISGSALAKTEIARAEQMAGRPVNRAVVTAGIHSHDAGNTWQKGH